MTKRPDDPCAPLGFRICISAIFRQCLVYCHRIKLKMINNRLSSSSSSLNLRRSFRLQNLRPILPASVLIQPSIPSPGIVSNRGRPKKVYSSISNNNRQLLTILPRPSQPARRRSSRFRPILPTSAAADTTAELSNLNNQENPRPLGNISSNNNIAGGSSTMETNRISIGTCDTVCPFCSALRFPGEKPTICCFSGKVVLAPNTQPPELLSQLLTENSVAAKDFRKNIRAYNSALAFTSMGVNLDQSLSRNGVFNFRIQGGIYHRIGSLLPNQGLFYHIRIFTMNVLIVICFMYMYINR